VLDLQARDRVTPADLREAMAQIVRLVRVELGPVRYCSFVEFTTGKGPRSGGRRRPHVHGLWKGLNPNAAPIVAGIAGHVLERIAGAWRHDVDEIRTPAGATMYVARHHLKESQAPPVEWGPLRRVRPSRGYWSAPAAELRERAGRVVHHARLSAKWWGIWNRENAAGRYVPEDVIEDFLSANLAEPRPEVVKVREVRGCLVEVLGSNR
jgi:hypothetical protein